MSMPTLAAADEVVELMLEVPAGQVIRYDLAALRSALGITDPTRIVVETDGSRQAMVTVYPSNPLANVRAVTREDLVMDRHGRIVAGVYHNGRPVRKRLFDPSTGSAQRFLLFGTTGAGKSRALQLELIAEKINGIVSWLADLKEGQSVPEAKGNVDFYGSSQEEAILILRSGVAVAHARMRRYSAAGRNSFALGGDPLLHVRIDEANRLLEKGAPYRDEATGLIKELGRTGRSVGVGIGLAAQASHLEELGGSDTLRAMLKEGEVTLLRWSSSMMRQLVGDGLLPAGEQLQTIPKTLAERVLRSQFDLDEDDDDDAPGTQGTGYVLSGPRPTAMMRHLRVGSIAPLPGLDPEILALYGDDEPARLEVASHAAAAAAYASRHDPVAMAALCQALQAEHEEKSKSGAVVSISAGHSGGLLEDRVQAVLASADAPMTAADVLDAVNADGGKAVKVGSVRNSLGLLADEGDVARVGRGLYALNR
ncbi:hypothetical protein [Planotetraspora phitsanulokensis]|uniref:Major plasmid transfer protein, traa n=2 Tax=Planotetraspora phitsanulokensis TaxID=575192 RepID=A0A8J3UE87_9ACTN|nr:hypothetical protein [Planotetraspora phitsanulokensis]GII42896.1 major plasmid transfer protein, traa [Planotetraspora phitsanulokensis]